MHRLYFVITDYGIHTILVNFSVLYDKFLTASYIPVCWKTSSVITVFKNSVEPSGLSNYRPVKSSTSFWQSARSFNQHRIGQVSHLALFTFRQKCLSFL